jgi:hypothetical protein
MTTAAAPRHFLTRSGIPNEEGQNRLAVVSQTWRIIGSGDAVLQGRR